MHIIQVYAGLSPKPSVVIDIHSHKPLTFETQEGAYKHAESLRKHSSIGVWFKVVPYEEEK
ncbi:hypothetical protein MCCARTNEY_111 [Bacillus phage vB_BanH_McCartney]|nr:hypothetical protein MCCARTNEY_111 [Bacillus phage vB_BanH_McCartney]